MPYKDPEKKREWNQNHREWHRDYEQKRYADDPAVGEKQRLNRKANLPRYAGYQRNYRLNFPYETLVNQAKSRAKRDGLPFDISVATLEWPTHCPILGLELDYNKTVPGERRTRVSVATLDRKTNKLGYVLGNVFVISHRANRIKSDATVEEMRAVVAYMDAAKTT